MAAGQKFEPLDVAKVSPFIVENHGLDDFLLILLVLPNFVLCEHFEHEISTARWGEPLGWVRVGMSIRNSSRTDFCQRFAGRP